MKYLFFLLLQVSLLTAVSAEENENYRKVADKFIEYYNSGETEKIYEMFSEKMKNALPLANFKQMNVSMMTQFGKLKTLEYEKTEGIAAFYKAEFEKSTWQYMLALNDKNEIDGMLIQPYTAPTEKNNEIKQN